jgi:hypothetical protein
MLLRTSAFALWLSKDATDMVSRLLKLPMCTAVTLLLCWSCWCRCCCWCPVAPYSTISTSSLPSGSGSSSLSL